MGRAAPTWARSPRSMPAYFGAARSTGSVATIAPGRGPPRRRAVGRHCAHVGAMATEPPCRRSSRPKTAWASVAPTWARGHCGAPRMAVLRDRRRRGPPSRPRGRTVTAEPRVWPFFESKVARVSIAPTWARGHCGAPRMAVLRIKGRAGSPSRPRGRAVTAEPACGRSSNQRWRGSNRAHVGAAAAKPPRMRNSAMRPRQATPAITPTWARNVLCGAISCAHPPNRHFPARSAPSLKRSCEHGLSPSGSGKRSFDLRTVVGPVGAVNKVRPCRNRRLPRTLFKWRRAKRSHDAARSPSRLAAFCPRPRRIHRPSLVRRAHAPTLHWQSSAHTTFRLAFHTHIH